MKIIGRTHHMLVSLWGKRWRQVRLIMFTAYIDDSGTDPAQRVANATALIVPASRIVEFQHEWDKLKKREGFTEFHTSEFVAKNPKSDFANWSRVKQARVFRRVRQICMKYSAKGHFHDSPQKGL